MKIVVIGGTGLIGSKIVPMLRQGGHEVVAASPSTGVNSITGEGLTAAMAGAQVVIDLANAPAWEDQAVLEFFEASGLPYTIIRATQFMEFLGGIAEAGAQGSTVRLSPGLFQPIAADDVAALTAEVALAAPRNGIVEIAGPERAPLDAFV